MKKQQPTFILRVWLPFRVMALFGGWEPEQVEESEQAQVRALAQELVEGWDLVLVRGLV
jgi:hypothetical protein